MEFVAKKKMIKVNLSGEVYEMALPNMGQLEKLQDESKNSNEANVMMVYMNFFADLGLPIEAQKKMDVDDFFEFVNFVMNPKKKLMNKATE